MSPPVGSHQPTLSFVIMKRRLSDQKFRLLIYKQYLDDCFLAFKEKDHIDKFLNHLNIKHNNILFSVKHEDNNQLSFLDIKIPSCQWIVTDVYRKDTFTVLQLIYMYFVPQLVKVSSIKSLTVHKPYYICCSQTFFNMEISRLMQYFTKNGYHLLFATIVNRFMSNNFASQPVNPEVEKQSKNLTFLFQRHFSYLVRNRLHTFHKHFPQIF